MAKRYPFNGFESMASGYTNGMYLPPKPVSEMNIDECRRGLCGRANGDVMACLDCENKCKFGRRIEELLTPVETAEEQTAEAAADQAEEKPDEKSGKRDSWRGQANKRKAEIKFLRIVASGNPKAYLEAHGMEIRNNMSKVRTLYKGVTPEEARKRLAEMGADVEETQGMPVNAAETPAEQPAQANVDKSPEERETPTSPVKTAEMVTLQIHELGARHFRYKRTEGGCVEITPNPVVIAATMADIDEICAEIKAAFEMMGGITE